MAKSLPPLSWLRSFEAAARNLSFTTAAEEIGLTQSAVSQQVKSLESRLGVQLFIRHARGLALTDAGRRLLPEVDAPLQALSRAMVGMDTRPSRNLLTIASSISVAHWKIAPRLTEFRARFPQTEVRILSAIWPDDFHSTRADVEIRFGSAQQAGPEAEAILPNDLIALKTPTLNGDVADLPLIETVGTSSGWQAGPDRSNPCQTRPFIPTPTAWHSTSRRRATAWSWRTRGWRNMPWKTSLSHGRIPHRSPAEGYHLSVNRDKWQAEAFREWLLS